MAERPPRHKTIHPGTGPVNIPASRDLPRSHAHLLWALRNGGYLRRFRGAMPQVYLALLSYASPPDWLAHPGVTRLARDTGLSLTSVHRALRNLEQEGLTVPVAAGGGRSRTTVYALVLPAPQAPGQTPVSVTCANPVTPVPPAGTICPSTGPANIPGRLLRSPGAALRVYLALARHAWLPGQPVRLGAARLAQETGLSVRSVRRALRLLEDAGLVETVEKGGGRGRPTAYCLPESKLPPLLPPDGGMGGDGHATLH